MPRAEIPESVEHWTIIDFGDVEHSAILVSDLPAIKAHWLEQLKEEATSDDRLDRVATVLERLIDTPSAFSRWEAALDVTNAVLAALDSIPIEEGGENG
jgi:hypothetical protein